MALSFANALGIHPQLLDLQLQSVTVYAGNLANSETPDYQARDFDIVFKGERLELARSSTAHLSLGIDRVPVAGLPVDSVGYRDDRGVSGIASRRREVQSALKGNSVDVPLEQSTLARAQADFANNVSFIRHRLATLSLAITGR